MKLFARQRAEAQSLRDRWLVELTKGFVSGNCTVWTTNHGLVTQFRVQTLPASTKDFRLVQRHALELLEVRLREGFWSNVQIILGPRDTTLVVILTRSYLEATSSSDSKERSIST